ncbi:Retrotransposon Gag-like protein 3 [Anabarilius grahami]|uniref:Retrotransposon Gag-like protein 3 n=1 Tax=Anabarilius grahami TaxID=495550 RepID=A0A3N0YJF4_ANAGA|nr:Retrotransposon Gag-like protein 3 [Anabarilius grahami]
MSSPDPFQDLVTALRRTLTSASTPAPPASTSAFHAAASSPSVIASPMAKPAPFSGSAEDCNGFILQCSLVLEMQPHVYPDNRAKVAFIIQQLDGKALRWAEPLWTQKSPVVQSLSSFISHFKEVFGKPARDSSIGLDPRVRLHLAAYEDTIGLEKFIQLSIRFATRMQLCIEEHQDQQLFPSFLRQPESVRSPEPADNEMHIDRSRLSSAERQRRLTQSLCLYCGRPGHFRAECPTRPARAMVSVILPSLNHENPLTIVANLTASAVCLPIKAFIDSGSAGNLISRALCCQLNLKSTVTPKIYQIHSVTGRPLRQLQGSSTIHDSKKKQVSVSQSSTITNFIWLHSPALALVMLLRGLMRTELHVAKCW